MSAHAACWIALSVVLVGVGRAPAQSPCADAWVPGISPTREPDREVNCAVNFDDGSGPVLVVGGFFTEIAGVQSSAVARWNGTSWSAMASASGSTSVYAAIPIVIRALAVWNDGSGPTVYAAGLFKPPAGVSGAWVNAVAKWTDSGWSIIGGLFSGWLRALAVFDDGTGSQLVAAGGFNHIGNLAVMNVARWNGSAWSALGSPSSPSAPIYTLAALAVLHQGGTDSLYAGAMSVGPSTGNTALSRWSGTDWAPVGPSGVSGVSAIAVDPDPASGPALVVAGRFGVGLSGPTIASVGRWDGTSWTALSGVTAAPGSSTGFGVDCLTVFDDGSGPAIYAGGSFLSIGPPGMLPTLSAPGVARFRNGGWQAVGALTAFVAKTNVLVPVLGQASPVLFAGGDFTLRNGSTDLRRLAVWNGSTWGALTNGSGLNDTVSALAVFDDGGGECLYAGGALGSIGGATVRRMARWNGTAWAAVPGTATLPDEARITALCAFDDGHGPALFAFGVLSFLTWFGHPFATAYQPVMRWTGSTFTPVGTQQFAGIRRLLVWDDGTGPALWGVGTITVAGGLATGNIVRWNGTSWATFPQITGQPGTDGTIEDAAVLPGPDGGLVVSGPFTTAGEVSVTSIAKWNGQSWDPLGSAFGPWNQVKGVAVHDFGSGAQIVCADTWPSRLSRYDGANWTVIASPSSDISLVRSVPYGGGRALLVALHPGIADGVKVAGVARFDGTNWDALGGGVDGTCADVVPYLDGHGYRLFFGGTMQFAGLGTVPAGGVACLSVAQPTVVRSPVSQVLHHGQPLALSAVVEGSGVVSRQWRKNGVPIAQATGASFAIPAVTLSDGGTYDMVAFNACGSVTTMPAEVTLRGCDLSITQPSGPGSLTIATEFGPPGAHVFTTLSFDPANAQSPGDGFWRGLFVPAADLQAQFLMQVPPFVTTLSASGAASFSLPSGALPPSVLGHALFGVATLYDALGLLGPSSLIAHCTLQ